MSTLVEELTKMGLPEREAAVYIVLLELGPTGALQISRRTGLNRPVVYSLLESLKVRGLVEIQLTGIKRKFAPASPDQFDAIMADHKRTFTRILPELLALYKLKGERSQTKYFEGVRGIQTVYEELLRSLKSGEPYYIMAKQENWESIDMGWLEDFIERRARRNFDTRIIFENTERGKLNKRLEGALNQRVRLISAPLVADSIVSPLSYIVHDFEPPITTVVIQNENIIKSQLALFRYIWDTLPE